MTFDCYNEILRDQLPGKFFLVACLFRLGVSFGGPLFVEKSGSQFVKKMAAVLSSC